MVPALIELGQVRFRSSIADKSHIGDGVKLPMGDACGARSRQVSPSWTSGARPSGAGPRPQGGDNLAGRRDLLRQGHAPSGEPAEGLGDGKVGRGLTPENFPALDP